MSVYLYVCMRLIDTQAGLTDLVDDFDDLQRQELVRWLKFYENNDDYPLVGVLEGPFYDKAGRPTDKLEHVERGAKRAVKSLELQVCDNSDRGYIFKMDLSRSINEGARTGLL